MKNLSILGLLILTVCCKPNKTENNKEVAQAQVEIESEKVIVKEEPLLAPKIVIENVELKCYESQSRAATIFGSGVRITCKITNSNDIGIKRVFLKGGFQIQRTVNFLYKRPQL